MKKYMKSAINFLKQHWVKIIIATVLVLFLSYLAYSYFFLSVRTWAEWTGFGEYKSPSGDYQRAKTLWDWLDLLIVPFALTVLAIWINHQNATKEQKTSQDRYQTEQQIAQDKMREESLQSYLSKITDLFLSNKLLNEPDSKANVIARAYTLLTLRKLDKERKRILLQFLYEMGLINAEKPLLSLEGADFSEINFSQLSKSTSGLYSAIYSLGKILDGHNTGPEPGETSLIGINLDGAILTNANFSHVNLSNSNLRRVDFSKATIFDTNLENADLSESFFESAKLISVNLYKAKMAKVELSKAELLGSNLQEANLSGAKLRRTNLRDANLSGTDFTEANLTDSNFKDATLDNAIMINATIFATDLEKAKSINGLIMDDGVKVEESTSIMGQYLKVMKKL